MYYNEGDVDLIAALLADYLFLDDPRIYKDAIKEQGLESVNWFTISVVQLDVVSAFLCGRLEKYLHISTGSFKL